MENTPSPLVLHHPKKPGANRVKELRIKVFYRYLFFGTSCINYKHFTFWNFLVKIAHSFLQSVSNQFHIIILSLLM